MSESRTLGPKHVLIGAAALLVLSMVLSWAYVAFLESDEAKVQRVISLMVLGAEARSPRAVTSQFTEGFKATGLRYAAGKGEVRQGLTRIFIVDYKFGFEVTLEPQPVPVTVAEDGTTATARFRAKARGKRSKDGEWIKLRNPEANGTFLYVATFEKTDQGWLLDRIKFEK